MKTFRIIFISVFFVLLFSGEIFSQGSPYKIVLTAEPDILIPDGVSQSLITAKVCDSQNNVVISSAEITFSLGGGGGGGYFEGSNPVRAVAGVANIIYVAGAIAGNITITATSSGLISGDVVITQSNPPAASGLNCEGQVNPEGISNYNPVFSWSFMDIDANDKQTACQVLVANKLEDILNNNGTLWNSGKVQTQFTEIVYNGMQLIPSNTYYWKVRVWDSYNVNGEYSPVSRFSMSLTPPKRDTAVRFLSLPTTSYVRIPPSDTLNMNARPAITIEMFIKIFDFPVYQATLISCESETGHGYSVLFGYDGRLIVNMALMNDPAFNLEIPPQNWEFNKWYHLAVCFTGIDLFVFRDGGLIGQRSISTGPSTLVGGLNNIYLGGFRSNNIPTGWFDGAIDELRISIVPRYTIPFVPPREKFQTDTNTAGLWHFDISTTSILQDSGEVIEDESGNNNHGQGYGTLAIGGYFDSLLPDPKITVTSPDGGEIWPAGRQASVTWTTERIVGNVDIHLSTDGGTNWTALLLNQPNNWSAIVNVPDLASTTCKIRVSETDGSPSDISNGNFRIELPGINIIYPNGGEVWPVNTQQAVHWNSTGFVDNVRIEISTNSGNSWSILIATTSNTGSKIIAVPNTPSSSCRIKVSETDGSPSDISNSNFSITSSSGGNNAPDPPLETKCNGLINPGGIDDLTPVFSWSFSDPDTGDEQYAYRLLVANSLLAINNNVGNIWDTQKTTSSLNSVKYAGTSLNYGSTYYWKVMTWDKSDTPGPYSEPPSFFSIRLPDMPVLEVSITELNFGEIPAGGSKQLSFNISNKGSGTLSGIIATNKTWLKSSVSSFIGNNITVNITVDNSLLNSRQGSYEARIGIITNGGDIEIPVYFTATCVLTCPNPYNPEKGLLNFYGSGIIQGKTVIRIYTINGEFISKLENIISGNKILWDGSDFKGNKVIDGVYIYTYETPLERGTGKFSVLRRK